MAFRGAGCPEPASRELQLPGRDPGVPAGIYSQDYSMSLGGRGRRDSSHGARRGCWLCTAFRLFKALHLDGPPRPSIRSGHGETAGPAPQRCAGLVFERLLVSPAGGLLSKSKTRKLLSVACESWEGRPFKVWCLGGRGGVQNLLPNAEDVSEAG